MKHPALAVRRCRIYIRDTPVHIPLDIFHIALIQDCADLIINIIYYFFSGEVKHELMSGAVRAASRDHERPVRMLPVEITVFIDHLRLDPDPELQAHVIDLPDQLAQAAAQFLFIHFPVAQAP